MHPFALIWQNEEWVTMSGSILSLSELFWIAISKVLEFLRVLWATFLSIWEEAWVCSQTHWRLNPTSLQYEIGKQKSRVFPSVFNPLSTKVLICNGAEFLQAFRLDSRTDNVALFEHNSIKTLLVSCSVSFKRFYLYHKISLWSSGNFGHFDNK